MAELLGVYDAQIMRHTVIDVIRRSAARTPYALAISYDGTTYTYRETPRRGTCGGRGLAARLADLLEPKLPPAEGSNPPQ